MTGKPRYTERRVWLREVLRSEELTSTAKLVAVSLAEEFTDAVTGISFVGQTRLGKAIGYRKRTAQRGVAELEALGFIDIAAPETGRVTNEYRIVFDPEGRAERALRRKPDSQEAGVKRAGRNSPRRKTRRRKPTPEELKTYEKAFGAWQEAVTASLGGDFEARICLMEYGDINLRELFRESIARGLSVDQAATEVRSRAN